MNKDSLPLNFPTEKPKAANELKIVWANVMEPATKKELRVHLKILPVLRSILKFSREKSL
jgi:hypothetical protein